MKRGHDAVSDETDPSARLTKQLKHTMHAWLKTPPHTEPRPLCLLDLPAGIVANIAQFIKIDEVYMRYNTVHVFHGDVLMYLCLVFGRQTARVIRREYLSNNLSYLDYLAKGVKHYAEGIVGMKKERCMQVISYLNGALKQWMQANPWWKDACRDAAIFAKGGDVCTKYPPIFKTSEVKLAGDEEKDRWLEGLGTDASSLVDLYFEGGPLEYEYSTVLAVDDIDLKNHNKEMTWEQAEETILKEGDKKFRVMHGSFAVLFLNPALAINLGMLELFRFQVKELMLDVNCQDYLGLFFAGPVDYEDRFHSMGQPLLLHVLVNPDKRFFECLLSASDFTANPDIERDLEHGGDISHRADTFLHRLPRIIQCDLPKKIDLGWVAHVIKMKEIDLGCRNAGGFDPVEVAQIVLQSVHVGESSEDSRKVQELLYFLKLLESYKKQSGSS